MDCKDLVIDGLGRVEESLRRTLHGLSVTDLTFRPNERCNSIAWMAWHLTRVEDDHISDVADVPQAWIADGWHTHFGRPADKDDTGYGHGPTEVASIAPASAKILLDYYAAVHKRTNDYLGQLRCEELDRVVDKRWDPPVTLGVRLISVVNDCTQHVGQMAYLRGLIEAQR